MKQQAVTVAVNRTSTQQRDKKKMTKTQFSRPTTSLEVLYNVGSG